MTDLLYTDVEESLRGSVRSTLQRSLDEGLPARLADEPDTDVGVEQVGHRGTSLKAMPLSGRWSGGRPSTRSAMTLRMISLVPPSIELPLARR